MRFGLATIVTAALLTASAAYAKPTTQFYPSFAPQNDLYIGANEKSRSQVTEGIFNEMIDKLEDIYSPIFKSNGGNLVMFANWQDGTVNAYTKRTGNNWEVHMFGGLARMEDMTPEGFAAVICHEFGHQVGGLPKKKQMWWGISWAAAEGQSDYFATAKCMKHLFAGDDNIARVKELEIPAVVAEKCEQVYADENDQAVCIRSAMAGEALGKVLAAMGNASAPSIETPSTLVVSQTNMAGYPSTQCRVDTYFQGALCDQPASIEPSTEDIHQGYCARENGYEIGARPLCWFNPEDTNNTLTSGY